MKKMFKLLLLLISGCMASTTSWAQDTATLRIKFVVDGKAPAPKEIGNVNDPFCSQQKILSDKLLVGSEGELANFALILDEEKSTLKVPAAAQESPEGKHELDNNKCMFAPKIIVARPGQTIVVKNSDQTGHNANFKMLKNPAKNFLVPAGQNRDYVLDPKLVEPTAMPVNCDVHPWMQAFIIVKPHPYVGVTDKDGVLEIKNLPTGRGAIFRVWHEAAGAIDQLEVNGKPSKLARGNRWEMELKPGMNDLGVVKISVKLLKNL